ncbi:MAG: Uma2 family endonuclease [Solirubrobacteraceae bacterium]
MRALILDPASAGLDEMLARRARSGLDRLDEVWEGVLHMAPAPRDAHADVSQQLAVILDRPARTAGLFPAISIFNLGAPDDYRVPDGGVHRARSWGVFAATAALVVEIVSPGDETWEKLFFYAKHHVDELLIVDPAARAVHWLGLEENGEYRPLERSGVIDFGPVELAEQIDWPPLD